MSIAQENLKCQAFYSFFDVEAIYKALGITIYPCQAQRECKPLTTLYLNHFLGLYLQCTNLRNEEMSPVGQIVGLLPCTIKVVNPSCFLVTQPATHASMIRDLCVTPVESIVIMPKSVATYINLQIVLLSNKTYYFKFSKHICRRNHFILFLLFIAFIFLLCITLIFGIA